MSKYVDGRNTISIEFAKATDDIVHSMFPQYPYKMTEEIFESMWDMFKFLKGENQ